MHLSQEEDIFYQSICEEAHQERGMEVEETKRAHHPKTQRETPKERQKLLKIFVQMEDMGIETKANQVNDTPSKRVEKKKMVKKT